MRQRIATVYGCGATRISGSSCYQPSTCVNCTNGRAPSEAGARLCSHTAQMLRSDACVRVCVHACVRACVCACMRACVHACVRACVRVCVHACTYTASLITSVPFYSARHGEPSIAGANAMHLGCPPRLRGIMIALRNLGATSG